MIETTNNNNVSSPLSLTEKNLRRLNRSHKKKNKREDDDARSTYVEVSSSEDDDDNDDVKSERGRKLDREDVKPRVHVSSFCINNLKPG